MADTATTANTGDHRRAATLTVHYGRGDTAGVNAVMEETVEVNRVTPLYLSVMGLHEVVVPLLLTRDGLACLTQLVRSLADDPDADPDCRRAARMILAHNDRDVPGFNAVLDEVAAAHRGSELLIGMFAVYSAFVPMLYSELGLSVLQSSVLDWAVQEEGTTCNDRLRRVEHRTDASGTNLFFRGVHG